MKRMKRKKKERKKDKGENIGIKSNFLLCVKD